MSDINLVPNVDENIKDLTKGDYEPKVIRDLIISTLSNTESAMLPQVMVKDDVRQALARVNQNSEESKTEEIIRQYAEHGDESHSSPIMENLDKGFVTAIKAADTILSTSGSAASTAKFIMSPFIKAKKKALGILYGEKAIYNLKGKYNSLRLTHTKDKDVGIYGGEVNKSPAAVAKQSLLKVKSELKGEVSSTQLTVLSDTAKEFLQYIEYKTKKGAAFNNIFDVTISDATGTTAMGNYTGEDPDFNTDLKFACTQISVGGINLTVDRKACLSLPLPTAGAPVADIKLTIQDYNFRNMYQYFYNWVTNIFDPHKRRFVSGEKGKYKNIQIDVYTLGGVYDSNSLYKTQYYRTHSITGINCLISDLPGQNFDYAEAKPSSFQVTLIPTDTFFDFTGDPTQGSLRVPETPYFDDYR